MRPFELKLLKGAIKTQAPKHKKIQDKIEEYEQVQYELDDIKREFKKEEFRLKYALNDFTFNDKLINPPKNPKKQKLRLIDRINNTKINILRIENHRLWKKESKMERSIKDSVNFHIFEDDEFKWNRTNFRQFISYYFYAKHVKGVFNEEKDLSDVDSAVANFKNRLLKSLGLKNKVKGVKNV